MKKKKISVIKIARVVSEILFFLLLPGLYISAFSGVKVIYLSILQGTFNFTELLPQMLPLLVTLIVTALAGRYFCGWMCAFGSLGDLLYAISKKVIKKRKPVPENIDRVLKYVKYVFLVVLIVVGWSFGVNAFQNANPWDAFGMLFTFGTMPDVLYVITNLAPAVLILLAIMIASFFVERFFCRYLCPMGAIFHLASLLRISTLEKPSQKCGSCRICTKNCPMGIPLYKTEEVNSGECINCFECISNCPRNNVGLTVAEQDVRPVLFSALALSAMTGAYYVGSFATESSINTSVASITSQTIAANSEKLYADGTYEGSGTGFRGRTTTLSVTVENGLISDINVLSTGDDGKWFNRAYNSVVSSIIEEQDYNVDAVSGATYSSMGIMEAVENALQNAAIDTASEDSSYVDSEDQTTQDSISESSDTDVETSETQIESGDYLSVDTNEAIEDGSDVSSDDASNSWIITPDTTSEDTDTVSNNQEDSQISGSSSGESASNDNSIQSLQTTQGYQDGTYEGSGIGFRGRTTTVSVSVEGGMITDISVISTGDDGKWFNRAYSYVTEAILDEQTTDVDAVTGATYSSYGIMDAIADALSKAE